MDLQTTRKLHNTTSPVKVPFLVLQEENLFLIIESRRRKEALLIQLEETSLERMEALLSHSAMGVHILFDNQSIANVLKQVTDDKDFYSIDKMKKVQDVMTALIAKRGYFEKMAYLQSLDKESYQMLLRAYFHIVENTVRANHEYKH